MATATKNKTTSISIPVTLPQIAESLRSLNEGDFETLALLMDKKAMRTVMKGVAQAQRRKLRELF